VAQARLMAERLDRFMARANAAYYAARDPFADFTTAPEISQVFGELLGLWAAVVWQSMGSPGGVILAEAGPGRGTLMADALRAVTRVMPDFRAALELHLVETSPRLRAIQAERLPDAVWHDTLDTLPPGRLILLANEFFDALPIRQFVRRGDGWAERHVCDGGFIERPGESPSATAIAEEGQIVEICEPARAIAATLGARLADQGGAVLLLDYGPERSAPGDSLQALHAGQAADPLGDPGSRDLTAHVDFQALAEAAGPAAVHGPVPQGLFLARLGLFQRTGILAQAQPLRAAALMEAARRLAEPDRMGRLFKALVLCHPDLPTPPGFAA
jgi:SAM-dependent MidA family methyltransferase